MAELPTVLLAATGGLAAGALGNYALWRGSPDLANLAVWQQGPRTRAEPSRGQAVATVGLLVVLVGGGGLLAAGVETVAGVPTMPVVLGLAGASFAGSGVLDALAGRRREGAFYLVAALMWATLAGDWVADPGRSALTAVVCVALGYFLMDVLDVGLPSAAGRQ